MLVDGDQALLRLRMEYLRAVEEGASEFTAEFAAGAFGLDQPMGDLSLAPPGARTPPELDVVLRCDGVAVLAGIPLQVAARSVTLEGLAFSGTLRPALKITAASAIDLRRVTVLGTEADAYQRAVVDLVSAAAGTRLALTDCTIADSNAPNGAALGLYILDGAWFDTATLRTTTIAGATNESVVMIEALRVLDARDCTLARGDARVLIRMAYPGERAELAACTLAAGAGDLLELLNPAPVQVEPMRLTDGTRTTARLDELPEVPVADDTVVSVADLGEEVADAVALARDRVRRADPRLTV